MKTSTRLLHSNEEGFTIIEVLIAGVIGVIVAYAIAKSTIGATQAERSSELDAAYTRMMSRLEAAIEDPGLCPGLWNTSTSTLVGFDPASPPTVDRLIDGGSNFVGATVAGGGPSVGVVIDSMAFSDPVYVTDGTYDWTFKIQVTKVPPNGVTYLGTPTVIRKLRIQVTSDTAAPYHATNCGPPSSGQASQQSSFLRFTHSTAALCTADDAAKDAACETEFSGMYGVATLPDLVAYGMVPYERTGVPPDSMDFVVSGPLQYTNANDGSRPSGTIVEVPTLGMCAAACLHVSAPLRFTRSAQRSNVANADTVCQTELGYDYRAANPNDLARYGVRIATNDTTTPGPAPNFNMKTFTNVVFTGGYLCALGYTTSAPAGPGIDCNHFVAAPPNDVGQLGCVLK